MAMVEKPSSAAKLSRTHPRSKFLKAITDKQHEISDWAKEGRPNVEFARQLGQLTENVTLDLMLGEHLFELSRARYKFKVNNRYEKKMFLQRQMMKSSALKDKLKDVQIEDKRPKWAQNGRPVSRQPSNEGQTPRAPSPQPPVTPSKRVRISPAPPPRPKPDSAPLRRNPILVTEEPQRAQTRNTFYEPSKAKGQGVERFFQTEPVLAPGTPTKRQRTPTFLEPSNKIKGMIITGQTPRTNKLPLQMVPPQTAPERLKPDVTFIDQSLNRNSLSRKKSRAAHQTNLQNWALANKAINEKRPVKDERYLKLERCLSDTYSGKPNTPNVDDIVQMIETLHAEPKRRSDRRPRVTAQVKAFLANSKGLSLDIF